MPYVGWIRTYRKIPSGANIGQVLWIIKYDNEKDGEDKEELKMKELADGMAHAFTLGVGGKE